MFVICDIEWAINDKKQISLTQIAASRVNEKWHTLESFFSLVRPQNASFEDWVLGIQIAAEAPVSVLEKLDHKHIAVHDVACVRHHLVDCSKMAVLEGKTHRIRLARDVLHVHADWILAKGIYNVKAVLLVGKPHCVRGKMLRNG